MAGATDRVDVRRHADAHLEPALVVSPIGEPAEDFVIDHVNRAAALVLGEPPPIGERLYSVFAWLPAAGLHDAYLATLETGTPLARTGVPYPVAEDGGAWIGRFDLRLSRHGRQLLVVWRDTSTDRLLEVSRRELAHERERTSTLQAAYLPRALPDVPDVELAWRYSSADQAAPLGGDWYDAVDVPGGLLLSVGDVAGHGLPAVETMAVLRLASRAYTELDASPSVLLGRLAHYAEQHARRNAISVMATMCAARYWAPTRELEWASAGHPPPLVVDADGAHVLAGAAGRPLGVEGGHPANNRVVLARGSTVVLYTDGLVERRDESIDVGLERLAEAAARAGSGRSPDRLCDALLRDVHDGRHDDDVCIVAARVR
jgi:serine phosphatase RsbU (regulator of sigma subunit)